jgi:hypothetical protein
LGGSEMFFLSKTKRPWPVSIAKIISETFEKSISTGLALQVGSLKHYNTMSQSISRALVVKKSVVYVNRQAELWTYTVRKKNLNLSKNLLRC